MKTLQHIIFFFQCLFESNEKNSLVFEKELYRVGFSIIYRDFLPSENRIYVFFAKRFRLKVSKDQTELYVLESADMLLDDYGFTNNFNINRHKILKDWYFWDEMSERFRACVERHINYNEGVEW